MDRATRLVGVVIGGAALLAFLALGVGAEALAQQTDSMSLQLTPSRDSGVSGTATITEVEEGVRVELDMRGLPEAGIEHINHFHTGGSCTADRAGNVAPATIPLKTIVAREDGTGSATTMLEDATVDKLFDPDKERYIALHSEAEEGQGVPPVISCADVVEAAGSGAVSDTLPESGGPQPGVLLFAGAVMAFVAVASLSKLVRLADQALGPLWRRSASSMASRRNVTAKGRIEATRAASSRRTEQGGAGIRVSCSLFKALRRNTTCAAGSTLPDVTRIGLLFARLPWRLRGRT